MAMVGRTLRKRPNKGSNRKKTRTSTASALSSPSSYTRKISTFVAVVLIVCVVVGPLSISSSNSTAFGFVADQIYSVEVVNEFPHDPKAFTEGLLYSGNDTLFESTGLWGMSSVRKVALQTGKFQDLHKMNKSYFGEGLTLLGERLFQLTWLKNIGFIYDRYNLSKFEKFTHHMQDGWGLATDGKILFGSDGTSTLYQIDPETMTVLQKHTVKYKDQEIHSLNELEYVKDEIWANVWMTDCIARISVEDGSVLGWILLPKLREGLIAAGHRNIDVLNGIAWDRERNRLFVTGKLWPKLFEIKLQKVRNPSEGVVEKMCIPKA